MFNVTGNWVRVHDQERLEAEGLSQTIVGCGKPQSADAATSGRGMHEQQEHLTVLGVGAV